MELINKKDGQITIKTKIDESLANAIRRYLNQINVPTINEVEIIKNDSPLYDETIAHRMGLLPLEAKKALKKEAKLNLKAKKEGFVYSDEIKGEIKPVYDKIPLTFLSKGQEIEIKASVKEGKGSEHSKYSPGLMFYRNVPEIKIEKDCPKNVVDICPKNILQIEGGKVVAKDVEKCDMCNICVEHCRKKKKNCIEIKGRDELIITVESFGQLGLKEMIKKSSEALKKDLAEVSKKLGK